MPSTPRIGLADLTVLNEALPDPNNHVTVTYTKGIRHATCACGWQDDERTAADLDFYTRVEDHNDTHQED